MFPTGANITTTRQSRFSAMRGTYSRRLTRFVLAMNMVMPPLDAENSQKNPGADELSRNSAEKSSADQSWNNRDCCGNHRRANVAPGIFPMEYPAERHVTQDSLHDVRQENTDCGAQRSKTRNQPEQRGKRDGAGNRR